MLIFKKIDENIWDAYLYISIDSVKFVSQHAKTTVDRVITYKRGKHKYMEKLHLLFQEYYRE